MFFFLFLSRGILLSGDLWSKSSGCGVVASDQDVVVNDIMKTKDKDADGYLSPQEFQAQERSWKLWVIWNPAGSSALNDKLVLAWVNVSHTCGNRILSQLTILIIYFLRKKHTWFCAEYLRLAICIATPKTIETCSQDVSDYICISVPHDSRWPTFLHFLGCYH